MVCRCPWRRKEAGLHHGMYRLVAGRLTAFEKWWRENERNKTRRAVVEAVTMGWLSSIAWARRARGLVAFSMAPGSGVASWWYRQSSCCTACVEGRWHQRVAECHRIARGGRGIQASVFFQANLGERRPYAAVCLAWRRRESIEARRRRIA